MQNGFQKEELFWKDWFGPIPRQHWTTLMLLFTGKSTVAGTWWRTEGEELKDLQEVDCSECALDCMKDGREERWGADRQVGGGTASSASWLLSPSWLLSLSCGTMQALSGMQSSPSHSLWASVFGTPALRIPRFPSQHLALRHFLLFHLGWLR